MKERYLAVSKSFSTISVPEWGDVRFRKLSLAETSEFEKRLKKDEADALAYLIAVGVVDEAGNRVFTLADIACILEVPAATTLPVATAIAKSVGVTVEQVEAKKNDSDETQ